MAKKSTIYPNSAAQKWQPMGWRIEKKYTPGVLMGNWYENRMGKVQLAKQLCPIAKHNAFFVTMTKGQNYTVQCQVM